MQPLQGHLVLRGVIGGLGMGIIGVIFLVAGRARLGWVTQFLSKPVMDGFITGLAFFVAVGQLNKLFGAEKGVGYTFQTSQGSSRNCSQGSIQ